MLILATTATVRRIRRSLDDDSVATLVHVCVTSRVDYCGSLLIGSLKKTTKKLQRVLNSAARIVSNTRKFDRGLAHFRRSELHWLDVVDRVQFRVCVQVFRCLHNISVHFLPNLSPAFLFAAICDQLTVVTWTSLVSHCINPLSNAALRPVSSLSISTRSAFGVLLQQGTI